MESTALLFAYWLGKYQKLSLAMELLAILSLAKKNNCCMMQLTWLARLKWQIFNLFMMLQSSTKYR
jgi:protein-tyrosine phosphatase